MVSFGDFGADVGEWASATGEQFNQQWYSAAPGEYQARMTRQARAWRNNQLEAQSQIEADRLRKQLELEQDKFKTEAERKQGDQKRWADLQILTSETNYSKLQNSIDQLRNRYNTQLTEQQQRFLAGQQQRQQQLAQKEQERKLKQGRIEETQRVIDQYKSGISTSQSGLLSQFGEGGGRFKQQLAEMTPGYQTQLAALVGTDDPTKARAFAEQSTAAYNQSAQGLISQYTNLRDTSLQKITQAEQLANQRGQQFTQELQGTNAPQYQGLTDIGLGSLGQAITSGYSDVLSRASQQSQEARQSQAQTYEGLKQGAYNPEVGYEARRDLQLDQSQRYGYIPQIYAPNLSGIQQQYQSLNPLMQSVLSQYEQTYGDWNQEALQERTGTAQASQQQATEGLTTQVGDFQGSVGGLLSSLQGGLLTQGGSAQAQARATGVSQQLGQFEQGMMSQISNYYSMFSNYLTQAQNEFAKLKQSRLTERSQLQGQQAQRYMRRGKQAQTSQANKMKQQRQRVSGQGIPVPQQQLLSQLTRGN